MASALTVAPARPSRRLLRGLLLAGLALAAIVALLWPVLPFPPSGEAPVRAGVVLAAPEDPAAFPRSGGVAPEFEWATPTGEVRRLSDLRGRPVVVNFWATSCLPCREELPALDRVAAADPTVTVLALDFLDGPRDIDTFLHRYRIERVEALLDGRNKVASRYGVIVLPATFFIGPDGTVRHVDLQPIDDAAIRAGIARAR
jgi:thiol-disulfide isomerase/thioredoxin